MAAMFTYMRQTPSISSAPRDNEKSKTRLNLPPPYEAGCHGYKLLVCSVCLCGPAIRQKSAGAIRPSGEVLFTLYMNFIEK